MVPGRQPGDSGKPRMRWLHLAAGASRWDPMVLFSGGWNGDSRDGKNCVRGGQLPSVGQRMSHNGPGQSDPTFVRPCGGKASVRSIHSSCGKPCGKTGNEDRNSLISNEKDQAAHKWVYCVKSLKISMLIIPAKFRVPMGEDFAGNPAITGFSTIGLRECPTGRGFWRSEPCRSNSCKAFARKDVNKRCPSCYRLSCRRAPWRGP